MAWALMPIGRRAESNHIRLLRLPHKRVGCKISVLRRASPTVIAITKFIVVYHRQEPQVACPKHIHFAKSDCHCMGNTPFSSYQLRQQLSGSVPYWKFGLVPLIDDHHCFNGMRWHCFFTGQKETLPSEHHLWKIWFKCEKSPSLTFCLEVPSPAEGLSAPLPACSVAR